MASSETSSRTSRDTLLLDSLDDSLIAARLDGTIVAWSRGATFLYGWTRDEAVGRDVDELLHTGSSPSAVEKWNSLSGPDACWTGELVRTCRDGKRISVGSRQHFVTEQDSGVIVVVRDSYLSEGAEDAPGKRRRQQDRALIDLRERIQFCADAAQIGYWFCNLPFDKVIWDDRVKEHFWLPKDTEVDMDMFYSLLHPDDREPTRRAIEDSIINHTRYDVEYRTTSPEGRVRWVRAIGRTAYAPDGTPLRFDGITQDITSLKRAQAEMRESQQQIAAFANFLPALAWMADSEGWLYWYNRSWYEYTGTTLEQMEGWGWQSVHDPEVLPSVIERWSHSIRTGQMFEMMFPLRRADGDFRTFLVRATPARNEQGAIIRWFGTCTEVDELERTRQQLALHEERIRVALKNAPIVLYTTDRDLRYTWMYRAHTTYPGDSILGQRDIDVEPEKFRELHEAKKAVVLSGVASRCEFTHVIAGRKQTFEYNIEPLHDGSGHVVGLTVAALDITHIRQAEDALRKSEKLALAGRLAASIAHEINNPLESVVSLVYVARNMASEPELRGYLELAEQELYRVAHVVTQSLRFHRQSTAASELTVSSLIDSALSLYSGRLKHSEIQLSTDFRDAELPLVCLASELRQVFANLIGNSFEATRTGRIVLRAYPSTHPRTGIPGVRAIVADTGHGIDAATMQRLFEPFVTTKGEFGTGLGLWVSAEILKRHHATTRVRSSTSPNHSGTVFSIFFPLASPIPAAQVSSQNEAPDQPARNPQT